MYICIRHWVRSPGGWFFFISVVVCGVQTALASTPSPMNNHSKTRPVKRRSAATFTKKPLDAVKVQALLKTIRKIQKKHKIPGLAIALISPSRIWVRGIGYANLATQKPIQKDTLFRIGSITKSFVALGFLKLVEAGKVQLNTPIRAWTSALKVRNAWSATDPIRIVHLLEHTAGFDDMHFNELYTVKHDPVLPLKDVLRINPAAQKARWRPGTWVSYSNPGYGLAGFILEQLTQRRYETFLKKEVLLPLGMHNAAFVRTKENSSKLAQGYIGVPSRPVKFRSISHRPAGALMASPYELAHFVQMLLNRGRIGQKQWLKSASIQRMETPRSALHVRKGHTFGYGLANYRSTKHGLDTFGHSGGIDGFTSAAHYSRKHRLGYVLLVNQSGSRGFSAVERAIRKAIVQTRPLQTPSTASVDSNQMRRWSGVYQKVHARNQLFSFMDAFSWLRISSQKNHLTVEHFALLSWLKKKKLWPTHERKYRLGTNTVANHAFAMHQKKAVLFVGNQAFIRRSAWQPPVYGGLIVSALVLVLLSILFTLIWLPRIVFWKRSIPYLRARVVPLCASLVLIAAIIILQSSPSYYALTYASFQTVSFFLLTSLFIVLSCVGAVTAFGIWRCSASNRVAKIFCTLFSMANIGLMLFFWPVLGIRLWMV